MANPTSAFFRAGPSLVPSPVTATTCLWSTIVLSIIPVENTYTHKQGKYVGDYTLKNRRKGKATQPYMIFVCINNNICGRLVTSQRTMSGKFVLNWTVVNLPLTSVCLSVGDDLARTLSLGHTLSIRSCSTWTRVHKKVEIVGHVVMVLTVFLCLWSQLSFPNLSLPAFLSFWQADAVPLLSRCGSSCWTLCRQCRGSPLLGGWYHIWWLWPWLCLCCLLSPYAPWCLHAGTSE